eukprot:gb/GECG01011483.1/.p1 GENE.gb/GECG01011483.1/~~gb/GECG01011483.1/.p1  ORF type:complete len:248 (+),score=30.30 gb/GECG01011483.1/:1-744(+)
MDQMLAHRLRSKSLDIFGNRGIITPYYLAPRRWFSYGRNGRRDSVQHARQRLGVSSQASLEEVKQAFRTLAKQWHPDLNRESGAAQKFKEINEAYHILEQHHRGMGRHRLGVDFAAEDPDYEERLRRRAEFFDQAYRWHTHDRDGTSQRERMEERAKLVMIIVPLLTIALWIASRAEQSLPRTTGSRKHYEAYVDAWYNPKTRRWETPSPWDPTFRENRHTLTKVPAEEVQFVPPPISQRKQNKYQS